MKIFELKHIVFIFILLLYSLNFLFGQYPFPPAIKAAVSASDTIETIGGVVIDGRDHDSNGNLLLSSSNGTYGVWTTSFLNQFSPSQIGGTANGIDYSPSFPANPAVALSFQYLSGGFPQSPDSVLGLPEGALKAFAISGKTGSQYVTNLSQLIQPLSGVTYIDVELASIPVISGQGILIIHTTSKNASFKYITGTFKGIIIADNVRMYGTSLCIGSILSIGPNESGQGKVTMTTSADVYYSSAAIYNAMNVVLSGLTLNPYALPNAVTGRQYHQIITASGGTPPYSITANNLPTWLSLSSSGVLSGIPTTVGQDTIIVIITDGNGLMSRKVYQINISLGSNIQGSQFWDVNKNGIKDAGESGLPNWKIRLYGTVDDSTASDQSGNYSFNSLPIGNYLVTQDFRTSWSQSYPASLMSTIDSLKQRGQIQIFKHFVALAQDAYNYRVKPASQGGGNGSYFGYTTPSSLTNNPYATFTRSISNPYSISFTATAPLIFWGQFAATCDSNGLFPSVTNINQGMWQIRITAQDTAFIWKDFGNVPFEIRGKIFTDYKDSKIGLAGFRVNLHGPIDTFAVTDANGDFVLRDFPWGTYSLTQDSTTEWIQSYPSPTPTSCESIYASTMAIQKHLQYLAWLAWYYKMTPYGLGGGGGYYTSFAIPMMYRTDSVASYEVSSVESKYVSIIARSTKYSPATINMNIDSVGRTTIAYSGNLYIRQEPGSQFIDIHNFFEYGYGGVAYRNFGNTQPTKIQGIIFSDDNLNGIQDPGEQGVPDWKVFAGGPVTDSTTTDSSGSYQLTNLPAGLYFVNESYRAGWGQTAPSMIPLLSKRDSVINNFNQLISHLDTLGADAYRYKTLSVMWGGGGGSYTAYTIPDLLHSIKDGTSILSAAPTVVSVQFTANSAYNFGSITVVADSVGKLNNFVLSGDFASLGYRIVDTDSSNRLVANVNFGNKQSPNVPLITGITPPSPSNNNNPIISGHAEVLSTVNIYANDCAGLPIATTSADSSGSFETTVNVVDNSTTILFVSATNMAGTSPCSSLGINYVEDSEAPSKPTNLNIDPHSISNNNRPTISGLAEFGSSIRIYANTCGGTPIAIIYADSSGIFNAMLSVPDNSTTTFYVTSTDSAGNASECSTGITYIEDSQGPAAPNSLCIEPLSPANNNHPILSGVTEAKSLVKVYIGSCGTSAIATVTADSFGIFSTSLTVTDNTNTIFYTTATDSAGNTSECSENLMYIEDSKPPSSPENLTVSPKSDCVTLHWDSNTEPDINRYHIYSDTVPNPIILIDSTVNSANTKLLIGLKRGIKYYFHVTAIDSSSNESGYSNQVDNIKSFNLNISEGWNLISIPFLMLDNRKEIIYPTSNSSAFAYQGSYVSSDTILLGKGYWVKYGSDQINQLSGYSVDIETVCVEKGWNMIGSISDSVADSTIISIPPQIITSQFFCYISGSNYLTSTIIAPGQGYWIKTNQAGKLIFSSSQEIVNRSSIKIISTTEKPPQPPPAQTKVNEIPKEFALHQNYPNPFNPSTVINYQLPIDSYVKLIVYNLLGQEVASIVDEVQEAGYKSVEWNSDDLSGKSVASGVYVYRLEASSQADPSKSFSQIRKMILMK